MFCLCFLGLPILFFLCFLGLPIMFFVVVSVVVIIPQLIEPYGALRTCLEPFAVSISQRPADETTLFIENRKGIGGVCGATRAPPWLIWQFLVCSLTRRGTGMGQAIGPRVSWLIRGLKGSYKDPIRGL